MSELSVSTIPHRPPFLFVDEIVEVSDNRILTRKLADPEADFFKGHYPGNPVMPGVLICESVFQAGALLVAHAFGAERIGKGGGVPVLARVSDASFKRMIKPGEMLDVEVVLDEELSGVYFLTGRVRVDEQLALRVKFTCALANEEGGLS